MLVLALTCLYLSAFCIIISLIPVEWEKRPTLEGMGIASFGSQPKKKKSPFALFRGLAIINKPICRGTYRKGLAKDLTMARLGITPEEFMFIQEIGVGATLLITSPTVEAEIILPWIFVGLFFGFVAPRFWLKGRISKIKNIIVKELPDAIDLLGLCVNSGLDFMLSLKWVVEKSPPSIMIDELNVVLQEINVGKTRRDAIKDLAARYELPDLSTFARTLIQADKMGTSVTDALNILSEDMRLARYRRGEQIALKAPLKMLVPLLVFIFPVVGILVAGPIVLDFVENNPFSQLAK